MSELRWVLLVIGIVIIIGTLVYSKLTQRNQERNLFGSRTDGDPLLSDRDEGFIDDGNIERYDSNKGISEYRDEFIDESKHSHDYGNEVIASKDASSDHEANNKVETNEPQEQHIVVLHVIARNPDGFAAQTLKDQLEHLGLRHGNYDFYHRSSLQDPEISLFSVANMFKPGAFDIEDIDTFATKGISFFLVLPGPPDALTTFNEMLQTAKQIASKLEADVYDADRSTFTGQRAQLIRDEIIAFMHKITQA